MQPENGSASQVWKFQRQSDGSYTIASTEDKKLLEMHAGITDNNNPVSVSSEDWGGAYQRWYVFKLDNENQYIIQSKHCSKENKVLTLENENTNNGVTILTSSSNNNNSSQIFSIYAQNTNLTLSELSVNTEETITTFNWTNVYGESSFELFILKNGEKYKNVTIPYNICSHTEDLDNGTYTAYVRALNAYQYSDSATVSFNVTNATPKIHSAINKSNLIYIIKTQIYNIANSCNVIVAGYNSNNKIEDIKVIPYENQESITSSLTGDIDKIKVMVWDSITSGKPLCEAEIIEKSEFVEG